MSYSRLYLEGHNFCKICKSSEATLSESLLSKATLAFLANCGCPSNLHMATEKVFKIVSTIKAALLPE